MDDHSSISDHSLSDQSSGSLDENVVRPRPRTSSSGVGAGGGRGGADRDMTEDEVAIMVKNALRKARKAMSSGDPISDDDSNKEGGDDPSDGGDEFKEGIANSFSPVDDEVDFGMSGSSVSEPATSPAAAAGGKDAMAKRIEEEIQSARAFAEKKYYGNDDKLPPSPAAAATAASRQAASPRSYASTGQSVNSADTPLAANLSPRMAEMDISELPTPRASPGRKVGKGNPLSPREAARERMARSKDKIAKANEQLIKKQLSPRSASPAANASAGAAAAGTPGSRPPMSPTERSDARTPKTPGDPKTPGQSEFDALCAVSPNPQGVPSQIVTANGAESPASAMAKSPDMTDAEEPGSIPSPANARNASAPKTTNDIANSPGGYPPAGLSPAGLPLSEVAGPANNAGNAQPPPPNTYFNKPREHRQVLFRHPYPLPPPPPLPRSDDMIIQSHSAPEKNVNVKWVEPDTDLAQLIEAAGEEYNLVRRSNACGALKMLASKENNKPKLCRTTGLLDVLVKASWDDAVDSDALDARTRAVTTLLYLSEPKDNRLIVARHPKVLECLVRVIEEDTGEARWRATSALATLAKTPGNRVSMGRMENLATVLGDLMVVGAKSRGDNENKENEGADGDGVEKIAESREDDNSTFLQEDSMTRGPSFETATLDDERLLTHTYTGTFTEGTGTTFTEDDMTYQSNYSDVHSDMGDDDMDHGSVGSNSQGEDGANTRRSADYPSDDDNSVAEEEGVEMQISSLKKLNIENASDFLAKSQMSACATLTHLTRHCANAPILCVNEQLLKNIIMLAGAFDSPLHTRCIEMLCNFTRFPSNNAKLASTPGAVDTLLLCGRSKVAEDRTWSIRTIQNLCSDAPSKVGLATGPVLSLLSTAAMRKDMDEQVAAVGALLNLSTEPGSIVPLTNTKTVVATLVHLAHSPNTPSAVRRVACDSLATIGLWLQTLASAGTVPEEIPFSPLPTHSATGWLRWDN